MAGLRFYIENTISNIWMFWCSGTDWGHCLFDKDFLISIFKTSIKGQSLQREMTSEAQLVVQIEGTLNETDCVR